MVSRVDSLMKFKNGAFLQQPALEITIEIAECVEESCKRNVMFVFIPIHTV